MNDEIDIKTERLLRSIGSSYKGVMLNAQHNFAWITGGGNNGIDTSRENGAATILVAKTGKRYLMANNIEMRRMLDEQIDETLFEPVVFAWQDEKADSDLVHKMARDIAGGDVVSDIPFTNAPAVESMFAYCRYELTDHEISRYRDLGSDAAEAIDATIDRIVHLQTEVEIANILRYELGRRNITSVVTLVAADDRITKFRHPVPTKNQLKKTLLIVTCAKRSGLIASLSRMVSIGPASDELIEMTNSAAEVNAALLGFTAVDASGRDLYSKAADRYSELGCGDEIDRHHQGGATGYRTREWVAHPGCIDRVLDKQAFAWNPTITGTKVEDTHILIDGEMNCITASDRFPKIESVVNGRRIISHGVLTI